MAEKEKVIFSKETAPATLGELMSPGASDCGEMRQELVNYILRAQCVRVFVTPGTVSRQAPPVHGILQAKYWSGLPRPPSGDLPDLRIEPASLCLPRL